MTLGSAIVLATFLLENHHRPGPSLPEDFSRHAGLLDPWMSDHEIGIGGLNEPDLRQFDRATDFSRKEFNLKNRSGLNPILLSTGLYNRVHKSSHAERRLLSWE